MDACMCMYEDRTLPAALDSCAAACMRSCSCWHSFILDSSSRMNSVSLTSSCGGWFLSARPTYRGQLG